MCSLTAPLRTKMTDVAHEALRAKQDPVGSQVSNKKLLGAPGLTTRSKDATRGSWPYY